VCIVDTQHNADHLLPLSRVAALVPGLPSAEFAKSLNEVRNKALAEQAAKQKVKHTMAWPPFEMQGC
jgi:hypothetical protein